MFFFFFFQAEDGIRDPLVTGVQTCALPISQAPAGGSSARRTFGVAAGGLVCKSCLAPGAATVSAPTVDLMSALLRGDWGLADASERRYRVECSGLVAAYVQWHLEHSIRSLRHVEHA